MTEPKEDQEVNSSGNNTVMSCLPAARLYNAGN